MQLYEMIKYNINFMRIGIPSYLNLQHAIALHVLKMYKKLFRFKYVGTMFEVIIIHEIKIFILGNYIKKYLIFNMFL